MTEPPDYKATIRAAVLEQGAFLRLTFSGAAPGQRAADGGAAAWEKVSLRPVMAGGRRQVQFAYTAGKKHVTKNFEGDDLAGRLAELLAAPFTHVDLQRAAGDLHVRITRKGKALVAEGKPSRPDDAPSLEHDRRKSYLLPADGADEFLRGVGILGDTGKLKAAMADKFKQINEFLRAIEPIALRLSGAGNRGAVPLPVRGEGHGGPEHALPPEGVRAWHPEEGPVVKPLYIVDCGCGNAYLTFAAFHYLRHVRGLEVEAVGVDRNEDLIRNCLNLRDRLRWPELDFRVGAIADFRPDRPPHIVMSLHACDTATDEAIARGVLWGSRAILAAPCCQHELHHAIRRAEFQAMLRHGLLRERMADLLTDSLRAAALRVAGYVARVFEFVSQEHTTKNLMIAAEKVDRPVGDLAAAAREYLALRRFWNVTPFIEKAIGDGFRLALAAGEEASRPS